MAVASATLHHLLENVKCKTLFITHYPLVASELERRFPRDVQNLHMGFTEDSRVDGTREITFLYRLTPGLATESFGVECARLAGIPEDILSVASERSISMRSIVENRSRKNTFVSILFQISKPYSDSYVRARKCARLLGQYATVSGMGALEALEELRILAESMTLQPPTPN